jgi:hypothetical protein
MSQQPIRDANHPANDSAGLMKWWSGLQCCRTGGSGTLRPPRFILAQLLGMVAEHGCLRLIERNVAAIDRPQAYEPAVAVRPTFP